MALSLFIVDKLVLVISLLLSFEIFSPFKERVFQLGLRLLVIADVFILVEEVLLSFGLVNALEHLLHVSHVLDVEEVLVMNGIYSTHVAQLLDILFIRVLLWIVFHCRTDLGDLLVTF